MGVPGVERSPVLAGVRRGGIGGRGDLVGGDVLVLLLRLLVPSREEYDALNEPRLLLVEARLAAFPRVGEVMLRGTGDGLEGWDWD